MDLIRLPLRQFLNIVYADVFIRWHAGEMKRRREMSPDPKAKIPEPTREEFEMFLDPSSSGADFFGDYGKGVG